VESHDKRGKIRNKRGACKPSMSLAQTLLLGHSLEKIAVGIKPKLSPLPTNDVNVNKALV
jgi:hypothetical protein